MRILLFMIGLLLALSFQSIVQAQEAGGIMGGSGPETGASSGTAGNDPGRVNTDEGVTGPMAPEETWGSTWGNRWDSTTNSTNSLIKGPDSY